MATFIHTFYRPFYRDASFIRIEEKKTQLCRVGNVKNIDVSPGFFHLEKRISAHIFFRRDTLLIALPKNAFEKVLEY
ncbi:hypothetical protein D104_12145 [Marinomonas profundimaris]|uniref:Uncharacterized protein n=1 Tax=Marinomonas profundimaris TaxID=1208321 RepID=W1RRC3_9GAMM|nr:hypothetical protein D104_12145 [Marinomonas profundimaris]